MSSFLYRSSAFSRSFPRQLSRNSWRNATPSSRRSTYTGIPGTHTLIGMARQNTNFIWGLIGANTAVFAAVAYSSPPASHNVASLPVLNTMSNPKLFSKLVENLPLSLNSIREGKYWTLVTSGFTHFGTMHFLGNMITLYAFSGVLTQIPGLPVQRLAILSFGSLISGSIGFLIYRKQRERPREIVRGIGASGMVMGLGAAAACLKPHQKFYIWGVLPVPLWLLIGGYFVFDYTSLESNSGTSHEGHLGGLAFGLLYYVVSLRMFGGVLGPRAIRAAPKQMWWRGR